MHKGCLLMVLGCLFSPLLAEGVDSGRFENSHQGGAGDYVADLVGRTFVRAFFDGAFDEMEPLLAERVNLDGTIVEGPLVKERLLEAHRRAKLYGRPRKVVTLPLKVALARFGPLPMRLRSLGSSETVVTFARLKKGGIIVFLRRLGGRWKVVGLSD